MATIYIDNKAYEVKAGQNLLQACLSLGFDLPYFCWHPAMHSVGACRQCAVKQFKDENDTRGKIVMSCMTPVADGMRISVDDPEAKDFRAGIIELLMVNHPHDCPVCDEGGECHLQDMTVMTGHNYRNYRFSKRTHRNQYLGPFINHEMNRCIQCYRCVRFYRDYAGGRDLNVFASHYHVYFGRYEDGTLENEFSGNLVEICPTGVFTDKTLKRHYTRKWDLQTAPSVCVHCGLGCNTIPGERYGLLRRVLNRYNSEVNSYFLCDRGRFGYEFVNSENRIRKPFLRLTDSKGTGSGGIVVKEDIMQHLKYLLYFGAKVIGIGSPRASLESNFSLQKLVGPENFYPGVAENETETISSIINILMKGPARTPSLKDVRMSDAVFVLGEDLTNSAPALSLALRQSVLQKPMERVRKMGIPEWQAAAVKTAIQDEKGPLFIAAPFKTKLDDMSSGTYYAAPDDLARLGFAVAHELNSSLPSVKDLTEEELSLARMIAKALKEAKRPLIISGTCCGSKAMVEAAANIAWSLCDAGTEAGLCYTVPECNSLGLGLMTDGSIEDAFKTAEAGKHDAVIILENDIYRRADAESVDQFLQKFRHVIVIDHLTNKTSSKADILLPAATFAESTGTLINNEGRAQRFFKVFGPDPEIQESWRWLGDMMAVAEHPDANLFTNPDDILKALSEHLPVLKSVTEAIPPSEFRVSGMKIPRQSHRYSGRTAIESNISVHEPKPPSDPDSPLSFSMEGYDGHAPSSLIPRYWSPGWNSVQSLNKYQKEVGGQLYGGDPGLRLIEPKQSEKPEYFKGVPDKFLYREDELLVVPVYHIFGSEELSVLSPGIAELAPGAYIAVSDKDAARNGFVDGEEIKLTILNNTYNLKLKVVSTVPKGLAGLSAGISGLSGIVLPVFGRVKR